MGGYSHSLRSPSICPTHLFARRLRLSCALIVALGLGSSAAVADVSSADAVLVSGTLTDASGAPIQGKTLFRAVAYASESGAAPALWQEETFVDLVDGQFVLPLGLETAFPAELLLTHTLYIGLAVNSGDELTPRLRVGATPVSWKAVDSETVAGMTPADFASSGQGCAKGAVVEKFDSSGLVGCLQLATVALTGEYDDLINAPSPGTGVTLGPTYPSTPTLGALHFHPPSETLYVWTGSKWQAATLTAGVLSLPIAATASTSNYGLRVSQSGSGAALQGRGQGAGSVGVLGEGIGGGAVGVRAVAGAGAQAALAVEAAAPSTFAGHFTGGLNYFEGRVGLGTPEPLYALHVESPVEGGIAARITNPSGTGATTGLSVQVNSSEGRGVFGIAAAGTGVNTGVWGRTSSSAGRGVYGETMAAGGGVGVWGQSQSANGWAGWFQGRAKVTGALEVDGALSIQAGTTANSTSGTALTGVSTAVGGHGVRGTSQSATGAGSGVFGEGAAPGGRGVSGFHTAATGTGAGIYGTTNSPNGYAGQFVGRVSVVGPDGHPGLAVSQFAQQAAISASTFRAEASSTVLSGAIEGEAALSGAGFTHGVYGRSRQTSAAGVYGYNSSSTGVNHGVAGRADSASGRGVFGEATSASGTNYGVYGLASSASGRGVFGYANAGSGSTNGVRGRTDSPDGAALYGDSTATSGSNVGAFGRTSSASGYGVHGQSNASSAGVGVFGEATASSGSAVGVSGSAQSTSGRGVFGSATASTGTTYGVRGDAASTTGRGVYGYASAATGSTYGVRGRSESTDGTGTDGWASASTGDTIGVRGRSDSPTGRGVFGEATSSSGSNYGVYGASSSTSGRAVLGLASASSGTTYGVVGRSLSTSGRAVAGFAEADDGATVGVLGVTQSGGGTGVYGRAEGEGGNAVGVRGFTLSSTGAGVEGTAALTWGSGIGVRGVTVGVDGVGVYGISYSDDGEGYGVVGQTYAEYGAAVVASSHSGTGTNSAILANVNSDEGYGFYVTGKVGSKNYLQRPLGIGVVDTDGFTLRVLGGAAKTGGGSWSTPSDERLKQNIAPLRGALARVLALQGRTFEYTKEAIEKHLGAQGPQIGLIAQQVREVFPEWVGEDNSGYLFITEMGIMALMAEALRELQGETQRELSALRDENEALRRRLDRLERAIEAGAGLNVIP